MPPSMSLVVAVRQPPPTPGPPTQLWSSAPPASSSSRRGSLSIARPDALSSAEGPAWLSSLAALCLRPCRQQELVYSLRSALGLLQVDAEWSASLVPMLRRGLQAAELGQREQCVALVGEVMAFYTVAQKRKIAAASQRTGDAGSKQQQPGSPNSPNSSTSSGPALPPPPLRDVSPPVAAGLRPPPPRPPAAAWSLPPPPPLTVNACSASSHETQRVRSPPSQLEGERGAKRARLLQCSNTARGSGGAAVGGASSDPASATVKQPVAQLPPLLPGVREAAGAAAGGCCAKDEAAMLELACRRSTFAQAVRKALHVDNPEAVALPTLVGGGAGCSSAEKGGQGAARGEPADWTLWRGVLKHSAIGSMVDLAPLAVRLPSAFAEQFPSALLASELLHRRRVSLGVHVVCRCTLSTLTPRQASALSTLAQCQLVVVVQLQGCVLHLVPYFDNANAIRMVGFLKSTFPEGTCAAAALG